MFVVSGRKGLEVMEGIKGLSFFQKKVIYFFLKQVVNVRVFEKSGYQIIPFLMRKSPI